MFLIYGGHQVNALSTASSDGAKSTGAITADSFHTEAEAVPIGCDHRQGRKLNGRVIRVDSAAGVCAANPCRELGVTDG